MADTVIQVSQSNNPTPALRTIATALAANVNRNGWVIQNQGTNALYVLLASGATSSQFHVALKGGTATSDGNGGTFINLDGAVYQGTVTVAGTAPSYTVLEL